MATSSTTRKYSTHSMEAVHLRQQFRLTMKALHIRRVELLLMSVSNKFSDTKYLDLWVIAGDARNAYWDESRIGLKLNMRYQDI
jgi:hypothetical protein